MNQPPGSALPLDSFLFPSGSYVLDGRYQVECLIGQNRETGSHVYRAVAVDAVPDLELAAGDRVVVKVMPSADTGMARAEYGFLRQAVDNWRDASVAQPVEVSSGGGSAYIVTRYVAGGSLREGPDRGDGRSLPGRVCCSRSEAGVCAPDPAPVPALAWAGR